MLPRSQHLAALLVGAWFPILLSACLSRTPPSMVCFADKGFCVDAAGAKFTCDNQGVCTPMSSVSEPTEAERCPETCPATCPADCANLCGCPDGWPTDRVHLCNCTATPGEDSDGDCIKDSAEPSYNRLLWDSDGDGLGDGCEDKNGNGTYEPGAGESNPSDTDSDGDALPDGKEDSNLNGYWDKGETDPTQIDSDHDGINDGDEDRNHNGLVDAFVDANGDGCFNPSDGDTPGESDPRRVDSDHDLVRDDREDSNKNGLFDLALGETSAWLSDTDCDGLNDGQEDINRDGQLSSGETHPLIADSDHDGILDGVEDANHNGRWDTGTETSALLYDTDGDGIGDGVEDRDHNGSVGKYIDTNGNGCFDAADTPGESNPRRRDTDNDGLPDNREDSDQDGLCAVQTLIDPITNNAGQRTFLETCAFLADTDCDGITDGIEDANLNGSVDMGETDPRLADSDHDGLSDGCLTSRGQDWTTCEDRNNNGLMDGEDESDPRLADTDGDGLSDSCERHFAGCNDSSCAGTDPAKEDSDGDGTADGEEDANQNCAIDSGETDPRLKNAAAAFESAEWPRWNVCATQNLKQLTYAESRRLTHDFRLAFEVERAVQGTCPLGLDTECSSGLRCENFQCIQEGRYHVAAFGKDSDGGGFDPESDSDELWGQVFQSPRGVLSDPTSPSIQLHRDIYGFLLVKTGLVHDGSQPLDDILDSVRQALSAAAGLVSVSEVATLPSRPTHDSLPTFRINYAQRQFKITTATATSAVALRNLLLKRDFLINQSFVPDNVPPQDDLVYGPITCSGTTTANCYDRFALYVGVVQRLDQIVPYGNGAQGPLLITIVALTPDPNVSGSNLAATRRYADRLTRLEDLTGGSALARYGAETTKSCQDLPQKQAKADVLWVVDDSRSMQQMVDKLQRAARDAQAVFTANSAIVDFRLAMTTTNPSPGRRIVCPDACDATCYLENPGVPSDPCNLYCEDTAWGCIKVCPSGCGENCDVATGVCNCKSSCGLACNGTCLDATSARFSQNLLTEALDPVFGQPLPGGGGTFYYEDPDLLDCDSTAGTDPAINRTRFLDPCNRSPFTGEFTDFYATGPLKANAGFLSSDPLASCTTALMDLSFNTAASDTVCRDASDPFCCSRLTEACPDGPTVIASQMCDLIRAMGGLPSSLEGELTTGARPHSGPESGSRSARRLIETMLPAYPRDYAVSAAQRRAHLRLDCSINDINCRTPCDPRDGETIGESLQNCPTGLDSECAVRERCSTSGALAGKCVRACEPVPLATIILSDEEDFWFKDDCAPSQDAADKHNLPALCRDADGDSTDFESCLLPQTASQDPWSHCAKFLTETPDGYDPDQTAWRGASSTPSLSDRSFSLKWRDANAVQCLENEPNTSCLADPCPLFSSQSTCERPISAMQQQLCLWNSSGATCRNRCADITASQPTTTQEMSEQQTDCLADADCTWDQALVQTGSQTEACVLRHPPNDCQPCKRARRLWEAVHGEIKNGAPLVGFGTVGPVYAITRDKGVPGFGGFDIAASEDPCSGGSVTWGRGDGQAYRDIAIATLGRTQNVCAASYRDFMQVILADIAVLSSPYPLAGTPIASTLKVGLARPKADGGSEFVEVQRSRSQGFIYDATKNSIGFKSDPIDGQCGGGGCSANNVIEEAEVSYARTAPHVPREGDRIYVSYRVWRPVPCEQSCASDERCVRVVCTDRGTSHTCPDGQSASCPAGYRCNGQTCERTCTLGALTDACVRSYECDACEYFQASTNTCVSVGNQCACNSSDNISCNPRFSRSCPVGYGCSDSCVCESLPGCGSFNTDGSVTDCAGALTCCNSLATAQANAQCESFSQRASCEAQAQNCIWQTVAGRTSCEYRYPQCCLSGEQPACYQDAETGQNRFFCAAMPCTCQSCPEGQYCCVECDCACLDNPH